METEQPPQVTHVAPLETDTPPAEAEIPTGEGDAAPSGDSGRVVQLVRNIVLAGLIGGAVGAGIVLIVRPSAPRNLVSVTCSNTASDASTLNSSIKSSHPGEEILISGTCDLTSPVVLLGGRLYAGGSESGTVLSTELALPYVVASDSYADNQKRVGEPFTLRDLTISCNGASTGLIVRSTQVTVENLEIDGCVSAGLEDTDVDAKETPFPTSETSSESTFRNLTVENCGTGFWVNDLEDSVIQSVLTGSTFASSTHTGIDLSNSNGWLIEDNTLYADGGDAIFAARMYATRITDNYVQDFAFAGGTASGITGIAEGGSVNEIGGNEVFTPLSKGTGDYIAISVDSSPTAYVTVMGNEILGNGSGTGLSYQANGLHLVVTSFGNTVTSVAKTVSIGSGVTLAKTT